MMGTFVEYLPVFLYLLKKLKCHVQNKNFFLLFKNNYYLCKLETNTIDSIGYVFNRQIVKSKRIRREEFLCFNERACV